MLEKICTCLPFIWTPDYRPGEQRHCAFRKSFAADGSGPATLRVFADSRYLLWLNGELLGRGPARFNPRFPEFDHYDLSGKLAARNTLVVLAHSWGNFFNSRIMAHAPGLALDVRRGDAVLAAADASWKCNANTCRRPSPAVWGFIPDLVDTSFDDGDWTSPDYDDSAWKNATPVPASLWGELRPRSIPMPRQTEVKPVALALPAHLDCNQTLTVDLGRIALAYPTLDFAAAPRTQLRLGFAQVAKTHSADHEDSVIFADGGRHRHVGGDTVAFRYLTIYVESGAVDLLDLTFQELVYPFDLHASFACGDDYLERVWAASVETVRLCTVDSYADDASREKGQWLGDAVVCSYPVGKLAFDATDARLLRKMLLDVGRLQLSDGRLLSCVPNDRFDKHAAIPDYICLWLRGLRQYLDDTSDTSILEELWPVAEKAVAWFVGRLGERGLVRAEEFVFSCNPFAYQVGESATLNCYFASACRDMARLAVDQDRGRYYAALAQSVGDAVNAQLWLEDERTYSAGFFGACLERPTLHAAIIALYFDMVPPGRRGAVEDWLLQEVKGTHLSPYLHFYLFDVLLAMRREEADVLIVDRVAANWRRVLELGVVSEGFSLDRRGGLVHQMGAAPACALTRGFLGIREEKGGLVVEPHLGNLDAAEGRAMTKWGEVFVRRRFDRERSVLRCELDIPAGVPRVELFLPELFARYELNVAGAEPVRRSPRSYGQVRLVLGAGRHEIEMRSKA